MASGLRSRKRRHDQRPAGTGTWLPLHDKLLDRIHSFLGDDDKTNMLTAFHIYSRRFALESYWRNFKFDRIQPNLTERTCRETINAEKFGHLFKKVVIEYPDYKEEKSYTGWMGHFFSFLRILTGKAELAVVEFKNLHRASREMGIPVYKFFCIAIANFLGSQHQLKKVSFRNCFFQYSDCCSILTKAIGSNNSIARLELDGFLELENTDRDGPACERILPEILDLPNLVSLHIDYRLVLGEGTNPENVLRVLMNHRRGLDMKIILRINAASSSLKKFDTNQWNALNYNPYLHVGMEIHSESTFYEKTKHFIVLSAPLTDFSYTFVPTLNVNLKDLFDHLEDTARYLCLRKLRLEFSRKVNLVYICIRLESYSILESLELTVVDSQEYLPQFLHILFGERQLLFLTEVSLDIALVGDPSRELLRMLNEFKSLYRSREITLSFEFRQRN